jgi:hypothetical protein
MRIVLGLLLAGLAVAPGCSSSSSAPSAPVGTQSLWIAPASLSVLSDVHFYDHPWPSDLRRDANGAIVMDGFYNPRIIPVLDTYVAEAKGILNGFSPAALGYVRFTGDIDPTTLPADPPSTLDPAASVQLIDVDPSSPEHGHRKLAQTYWRQTAGVYWLADTLAIGPALGWPLRPNTKYASVVTNKVRALDGSTITPSADLSAVLGVTKTTSANQAAHDLYAPAVADLTADGIAASEVIQLAVFTTNDPTAELFAVADDVPVSVPAPIVDATSWSATDRTATYDVYEGNYGPSPNYQAGTIPFLNDGDGGNFVLVNGKPQLQGTFSLRFALVVPNATACPMPATGYPIMLYASGTGGDYRSSIDDGTAGTAATNCIATMGIDQIFEGTRPGAPPASDPNLEGDEDLMFFNLNNLVAARTNGREGAIDVVQQARLFSDTHTTVPSTVSRTMSALQFDASKMTFFGHSEGGLNGPLFLASSDLARGGVLSGSGSMITVALLEKTSPTPSVAAAVQTILELNRPEDAGELNLFHPVVNLAQTIIDTTDPIHYVGYLAQHPRAGFAPKSIFQTEGVNPDGTGDTYAPPHGIELGSIATGLPRMLPGEHPRAEASWGGLGDVMVPAGGLSGNLADGGASGVLAQYVPPSGVDGHFVVFYPPAQAEASLFIKNLAANPLGNVPAPSQ